MKISILILASLLGTTSWADEPSGRNICLDNNVESLRDEAAFTEGESLDISGKTDKEINELSVEIKEKLVITAKWAIEDGYCDRDGDCTQASEVQNAVDAVKFIRAINENPEEELSFTTFTSRDTARIFNTVTFYPGAQVGLVFLQYWLAPVATISDGDPMCVR